MVNEMGVLQGILINGQFPGPQIDAVTNDNLVVNVYNNLNEPFLLSWYTPPKSMSPCISFSSSPLCTYHFLCS